ncbi:pentapeptide repeat-containing protein [Rothia dentocariosa]|uniref:pentapeptide repeat-containing protein n=6 Tax=Rothia dentocariosa TaxID=2047 RepID=UPI0024489C03|nr:pentapeptide repeat-containing protein [Rothia dentocariosa]
MCAIQWILSVDLCGLPVIPWVLLGIATVIIARFLLRKYPAWDSKKKDSNGRPNKPRHEKWFYAWIIGVAVLGGTWAFFLPIAINSGFGKDDDGAALRQALIYTTGGILGVITLGETHRKNTLEKDKNDQDHTRQVHAERRSRYTTAVEQLSSDKASIRLGGVYTLVGLVDEWLSDEKTTSSPEERHKEGQVIINNLCAYIRSPFPLTEQAEQLDGPYAKDLQKDFKGDKEKFDADKRAFAQEKAALEEECQVRQSIIKEICERLQELGAPGLWSEFDYDFSNAHFFYPIVFTNSYFGASSRFFGATFTQDADFSGAIFTEGAPFSEATFTCTPFSGTTFTERAPFSGAIFTEGVDFSRVTFTQDADFSGTTFTERAPFSRAAFLQDANFSRAAFTRDAEFFGAKFTGDAHFSMAKFTGDAHFSMAKFTKDAHFSMAKFTKDANFFEAEFTGNANFSWAKFTKASFSRAKFTEDTDFSMAKFTGDANFSWAKFTKDAHFSMAEFTGNADFSMAEFTDADFFEAEFTDADFSKAEFTDADFFEAEFTGNADFSKAEFTDADFPWAKFTGNADFSKAEFTGNANFSWAKFTKASFSRAKFTEDTDFSGVEFTGDANFSGATFEEKPIFERALGDKTCKARFSCKADPEDYNFEVSPDSPYKIETEEKEYNETKFIIPKGAELFDPDEPSEQGNNDGN